MAPHEQLFRQAAVKNRPTWSRSGRTSSRCLNFLQLKGKYSLSSEYSKDCEIDKVDGGRGSAPPLWKVLRASFIKLAKIADTTFYSAATNVMFGSNPIWACQRDLRRA